MNTISIRQAVLADIETLAALFDEYRQFYGRASDKSAARSFLVSRFEHGESVLFLAFEGDDPLGFMQLYPSFSSISLARIFILNDLFVRPSGRKKGIGTGLIRAAVAYAKDTGAIRLALSTANTNTTAQALYQSLGWQRDEQFLSYTLTVEAR